jgi:hypothetical protein
MDRRARHDRVAEAASRDCGTQAAGERRQPANHRETRQYIRDFDRIAETAKAARELYDQMLKLHPLRMNVNALWTSALAIKG